MTYKEKLMELYGRYFKFIGEIEHDSCPGYYFKGAPTSSDIICDHPHCKECWDYIYRSEQFREIHRKKYTENDFPNVIRYDILHKVIDTKGKNHQTDRAIEEMSELSKALLKYRRAWEEAVDKAEYDRLRNDIYEEMADVIVMITQLIMIYGGKEIIQKYIDEKVDRLEDRLNSANDADRRL